MPWSSGRSFSPPPYSSVHSVSYARDAVVQAAPCPLRSPLCLLGRASRLQLWALGARIADTGDRGYGQDLSCLVYAFSLWTPVLT